MNRPTISTSPRWKYWKKACWNFAGALVLVTHDRYMLDRVSTIVLGLDGLGGAERFADYSQWDAWQRPRQTKANPNMSSGPRNSAAAAAISPPASGAKKKLSYIEARELATIEERIAEAEKQVDAKRAALEDPAITSDAVLLRDTCVQLEEAQKTIDTLYARWAELEQKQR